MRRPVLRSLVLCVAAVVGVAMTAGKSFAAFTLSFENVSHNNAVNEAIGESQLSVTVSLSGDQASFKFENNVGQASSITDIYFTESLLSTPVTITTSGAGVSFSSPATPPNPPSASGFTTFFSADSSTPANGVDAAGEFVTITFDSTFTSEDDIKAAFDDGSLRIAVHVQAFANGGSETFEAIPPGEGPLPVPAPAGLILMATGAPVLLLGRRVLRRRQESAAA